MRTIGNRLPKTGLLVAAIAVFSLAAVACSTDSAEITDTNEGSPAIGAPAGVVGSIGTGSVDAANQSTGSVSVANGEISTSDFGVPAVEPVAISAIDGPISQGVPSVYSGQVSVTNTANSGIWVTGQATLEIPADVAKISIGVESREETVADARQEAAEAMEGVLAGIREQGVADDDIVTSNFNIQPQTVWVEVSDSLGRHSEPRIAGYIVSNTVQVTVRDIDNLSPVVDTAATAGGDLIRINSIQFTVDDPSVFGEQMRELAAADALAKADVYARALGVSVGQLLYLTEIGSSVPMARAAPAMEMAMDAGFAPTPINAGDVDLSVTVQVVFAIAS